MLSNKHIRLSSSSQHLCVLVLVVGIASRASAANIVTVPPGLAPGAPYRLVFVTSITTDATSTDIGDYNNFVTSVADSVSSLMALNATWTVLGSTESISAATNIGNPPGMIYNLAGQEVAPSTAGLFNTWQISLLNSIDIDQMGDTYIDAVWTGTWPDGSPAHIGTNAGPLGDSDVMTGIAGGSSWMYLGGGGGTTTGHSLPLYAISSELTAPFSSPEPTTIGLTALGGVIILLAPRHFNRLLRHLVDHNVGQGREHQLPGPVMRLLARPM